MHRIIVLLVATAVAFAESGVGSSGAGSGGGGSEGGGGGDGAPAAAQGSGNWIFIAFFVLMGFMLWSTFRSQKKEKQKQQQLIANLTIGNRVETIGGLRGEVVRKGEGELDIRSGESVFTIALGAVKQLVADDSGDRKE